MLVITLFYVKFKVYDIFKFMLIVFGILGFGFFGDVALVCEGLEVFGVADFDFSFVADGGCPGALVDLVDAGGG